MFLRKLLKFVRPESSQVFNFDSSDGLKFLIKLKLRLSHLADHKFRHNFQDNINSNCSCGQEIETLTHFPLHCSNFHCAKQTLFG